MQIEPKRPAAGAPKRTGAIRNVFSNWGAYVISMGVNFFVSPLVVLHLGNAGYGVWTLLLSLTGYLGLLDLGVRGAVTRYIAKYHAGKEHGEASRVASSAMAIFAAAGAFAILISIALGTLVLGRTKIPVDYLAAGRLVIILIGVNVAVSLVSGVFGGVMVGLQRFDLINAIEIGANLLRATLIVLALHKGYGIITLALIQLGFTVARWIANMVLTRHFYPELRIAFGLANKSSMQLIFSFSIFSFLLHVSGSLIYASDNVVIGAYLPVTAITFYAIAGNLLEYTRTVVAGISQTMTPLASSIEVTNDSKRLQEIALLSSRAGSMIVLPIALSLMLRGGTFINLWIGPQYGELSGRVLFVLSLTLPFWAANSVTAGSLLGLSKHKPIVPGVLAEGLCNLLLSVIWVQKFGIVGVAWGTLVPSVITSLLFWPWYIHKALGIAPVSYVFSAWVRPFVGILPFAMGTYVFERFLPPGHLMVFLLQVLSLLPLGVCGYWFTCLDAPLRARWGKAFARSLDRVLVRS